MSDYADLIKRLRGTYPTRADRWADCAAAAAALEEAGNDGKAACKMIGLQADDIARLTAEVERLRGGDDPASMIARMDNRIAELEGVVRQAAGWFATMSSADGSGHADLGRRILARAALTPAAGEEARKPDQFRCPFCGATWTYAGGSIEHMATCPTCLTEFCPRVVAPAGEEVEDE